MDPASMKLLLLERVVAVSFTSVHQRSAAVSTGKNGLCLMAQANLHIEAGCEIVAS